MSIKAHGKSLERKVKSGSETVGRDVKKAGRKVEKGARIVGRDVEKVGKRVTAATRHGVTRVRNRVARARHA
ncbi:MAG: hypothetical protein WB809_00270 [Thermoplasmata archaeon]